MENVASLVPEKCSKSSMNSAAVSKGGQQSLLSFGECSCHCWENPLKLWTELGFPSRLRIVLMWILQYGSVSCSSWILSQWSLSFPGCCLPELSARCRCGDFSCYCQWHRGRRSLLWKSWHAPRISVQGECVLVGHQVPDDFVPVAV